MHFRKPLENLNVQLYAPFRNGRRSTTSAATEKLNIAKRILIKYGKLEPETKTKIPQNKEEAEEVLKVYRNLVRKFRSSLNREISYQEFWAERIEKRTISNLWKFFNKFNNHEK